MAATSCLRAFGAFLLAGVLLLAADPSWKNKPIPNWTEEDAKQVLADSPWAETVRADIKRLQTEDIRRAGGNTGNAKGVGFDGLEKNPASSTPQITLQVRWESAFPIRAAELKAGINEPPALPGDGYLIAVYGIPTANVKGDPKTLGAPLKNQAFLKRDGKKDAKPIGCEVFQREDSMVAVYLFPLSAEIGKNDMLVQFSALIGRIAVQQVFNVEEMQFQGKLEL